MKRSEDVENARKAFIQMVENKEAVRSYIKGEIDLQTLRDKGVKLATPI